MPDVSHNINILGTRLLNPQPFLFRRVFTSLLPPLELPTKTSKRENFSDPKPNIESTNVSTPTRGPGNIRYAVPLAAHVGIAGRKCSLM